MQRLANEDDLVEPEDRPDRKPGYHPGMVGLKMFKDAGSSIGQEWVTFSQPAPLAYLEHSCDEWIIGGVENIKALIHDLEGLLASDQPLAKEI